MYDDSGSMIHDISVTEQMVDGSIINIPHPPSITHTNKNKAATRKRKAAAAAIATSNEDGDRIIRRFYIYLFLYLPLSIYPSIFSLC